MEQTSSPAMAPEIQGGVPGTSATDRGAGRLLRLAAHCPRCGARPEMRVTEAMVSALVSLDPWMSVGTYTCQTLGCGTVYDIVLGAYTAAFEGEADPPQIGPDNGEARLGLGNGALSVLEDLAGSIEAPADWSAEHDHYLYGTPKRAGSAE